MTKPLETHPAVAGEYAILKWASTTSINLEVRVASGLTKLDGKCVGTLASLSSTTHVLTLKEFMLRAFAFSAVISVCILVLVAVAWGITNRFFKVKSCPINQDYSCHN